MEKTEWRKDEYLLSTDKSKIDVEAVHRFLSHSYWAQNIPLEVVQKSIDNSLCFAIYHQQRLIGFARAISDFATFAYLADVFILPEERGKGLSKWLMEIIMDHPQLRGLRRFTLLQETLMVFMPNLVSPLLISQNDGCEKHDPEVYKRNANRDPGDD